MNTKAMTEPIPEYNFYKFPKISCTMKAHLMITKNQIQEMPKMV